MACTLFFYYLNFQSCAPWLVSQRLKRTNNTSCICVQLVFYLFSPSIIFSNLAESITLDSLTNLWVQFFHSFEILPLHPSLISYCNLWLMRRWFMPVNILLTFIIGSALAWILVKITRAPQHLRSLIIGSCAAGRQKPKWIVYRCTFSSHTP